MKFRVLDDAGRTARHRDNDPLEQQRSGHDRITRKVTVVTRVFQWSDKMEYMTH
jgi:hypothetical protein